jgi:hypothetical protein
METQRKQHCKSYKERQREAVCFLPSPNNYQSLKFQDTNYQSFFLMKISNTRQTDRQTEEKLAYWVEWNWKLTTKREMVFWCSDDEFVAANFVDSMTEATAATDRQKKRERGDS